MPDLNVAAISLVERPWVVVQFRDSAFEQSKLIHLWLLVKTSQQSIGQPNDLAEGCPPVAIVIIKGAVLFLHLS
jgi:hypothetical protein